MACGMPSTRASGVKPMADREFSYTSCKAMSEFILYRAALCLVFHTLTIEWRPTTG
jgi:hypothetical protein